MLSAGVHSQKKKGKIGTFLIKPLNALIASGLLAHVAAYLSQSLDLTSKLPLMLVAASLLIMALYRLQRTHDLHPYFMLFATSVSMMMLATFIVLAVFQRETFQIIWTVSCAVFSGSCGYHTWKSIWDFDCGDSE